jgi:hypothetical protein
MQLEQVNFFEMSRHLSDTERLAKLRGVVLVYDKATIDINQQNGILVLVGDRVDADSF